jgi:hypothetical protein
MFRETLRMVLGRSANPALKKSYSQPGEDLIVKYIFDVLQVRQPSYMDIGSHRPFFISNSAFFYANGSRGILYAGEYIDSIFVRKESWERRS